MRDRPKYNPALEDWIKHPNDGPPPSISFEEFKVLYGHLRPKPGQYDADGEEAADGNEGDNEKGPED